MWIGETNVSPLLKAFQKFEMFRVNDNTEQEKAGTIQAFEFCFELVWKTMRRILAERGKTANSPREVFRMAALEGLIDDPEIWFDFLKKRNLTMHTYQEVEVEKVLSVCPLFSEQIQLFLKKLEIL